MSDESGFYNSFFKKPVDKALQAGEELVGAVQNTFGAENQQQGIQKRKDQRNYNYTYIKYPATLGQDTRHPYFITFYINIQDLSKYVNNKKGKTNLALNDKGQKIHSTVAINQRAQPSYARNADVNGTEIGFARKTSRTKTGIRLYMPDTLSWSYQNEFRGVSLSGNQLAKLGAIGEAAYATTEAFMKGGPVKGLSALLSGQNRGLAAEIGGGALLGDEGLALSAVGMALNPQMDVIYETPTLRSFNFEFNFAPRTPEEGRLVQQIIKTFKFHSAPEILSDGGIFGRYFVPPSEFDIEFSVNSMGKISTCVLESITVDYGPTGAAFYADNTPVHTKLMLQFKELEYITKELIQEQGY